MTRLLLAVLLLAGCGSNKQMNVTCYDKDGKVSFMVRTSLLVGPDSFDDGLSVRCEVAP